ncbi:MAG: hypothetical protein ACYDH9_01780 [Limisphaerales bacterium]
MKTTIRQAPAGNRLRNERPAVTIFIKPFLDSVQRQAPREGILKTGRNHFWMDRPESNGDFTARVVH